MDIVHPDFVTELWPCSAYASSHQGQEKITTTGREVGVDGLKLLPTWILINSKFMAYSCLIFPMQVSV